VPRRRTPIALLFALLVAGIVAVIVPTTAAAAPGVVIGLEQNGGIHDPARRELILDSQRDAGARVVRVLLRYDQVATCDPGAAGAVHTNRCYDWSVFDAFVRGADARGMQVLLSIYGVPKWKFNGPENFLGTTDAQFDSFVASYATFVQAAATRYDGRNGLPRVSQWTIWNEPNGSFFQPRWVNGALVGPARYARMYDAAARRIKAVDQTLRVGVGPTAPIASSLPPVTFAKEALPHLQRLGSPIDAWAHNAYIGKQSPWSTTIEAPYVGLGNVDDLTAELDRYGVARGAQLWITEFGYQTAVEGRQLMTEQQQALLLADAVRFAHWHPRITTFIWYSLHDDESTSGPYGFQSGLYRPASEQCDGGKLCPKQSLAAYRRTLWVSPVSGGKVTVWAEGRIAPSQTRVFVRYPGQGWKAYANPTTATTGIAQVRLKLVGGMQVAACDSACGAVRTLSATVSGGGGNASKVQRQQLAAVTLPRRSSLARGISFGVPCQGCRVSSVVIAKGRASGIRAAARRQVVVARAKVRRAGTRMEVRLAFTRGARRELGRVRSARLTIRTTIRSADGKVVIADRPLLLR
jgi:hypothetical protein